VLFSLLYIGLCRIFALIPCTRRSKWDKDIKIMVLQHKYASSNVRSTHV